MSTELDEEFNRLVELDKKDKLLRMMRKSSVAVLLSSVQIFHYPLQIVRQISLGVCLLTELHPKQKDIVWKEEDTWEEFPVLVKSYLDGMYRRSNQEIGNKFQVEWEADIVKTEKILNLTDCDILDKLIRNRLASLNIPIRDFGFKSSFHALKMLGVKHSLIPN